jgi:hypothetical protein
MKSRVRSATGVILIVLLLAVVMTAPAESQTRVNPNNIPPYFYYSATPTNNKAYRSKIDTLTQVPLGGASVLSFVVHSSDTMRSDIYLDYLLRDRVTWTQVYADSFIAVRDTVFEYVFRSHTTDRVAGYARKLRLRISHRTTSDFDSTTTYTGNWIWKP